MKQCNDIVIAGGGLAGQRCAEMLRRCGHEGRVTMLCAEPHRPYDRPPLSKEVLSGEGNEASLPYRPADWYESAEVELELGLAASALLPDEHLIRLADGRDLRYDKLLIATGSRPRMLPALNAFPNVSVLRTLEDAVELRSVLGPDVRIAVIGAGFIGQEVAATARKLGAQVTMIEAAPTPLAGVLGAEMGEWFAQMHRAEGVEVLLETTVRAVSGNGTLRSLELSCGRKIEVDHVVVGVGVAAEIDWLAGTGLQGPYGVPADVHGRTADPDVFAAGDAAATFDRAFGAHVPGSHWEAAGRQGARAARAMLGLDPGEAPVTSFWTDQYGIRIQYLGRARLADAVSLEGDAEARNFTATFTREGRAVAALLVGRPRHLPAARKMIENGESHVIRS
jgi:NADPH-dependent 2,4-dienoyl-CoA reductase/sulfur reductase-like enzyme